MPNIIVNSTILLPPDMVWQDEAKWSPVARRVSYGLTGAPIIQVSKKLGGRIITLASSSDTAWVKRSVVETLQILERLDPDQQMPLVMASGVAFNVMFAGEGEASAIVADAVQPGKFKAPGDYFRLTLRFMEIPV